MKHSPQSQASMDALRDPLSVHNERLDAEFLRFAAVSRRSARRFGFYAVLGAVLVVCFGVWGFRFETNTRLAPVHLRPASAAVMVVINPRDLQR